MLSRENHWVLIAGGLKIQGEDLCIFDSKYRGSIENELGENVAKILLPTIKEKGFITFRVQRVTLQKRNFCGYFSLANLCALCFGLDPEALLFDEDEIRDHYIKIVYDNHDLTMFPYSSKRKSSVKNTLIK